MPLHIEPGSVCYLDDYHPYVHYIWLPIRNGYVIVNKKTKRKATLLLKISGIMPGIILKEKYH
ncbi:MAG: hypothetical protein B5M53_08150 [Candidatus Cloacimonas sp. 4484_209]|nr:MAG: hypothetical protein B5M53_08150 [Candidatus Cloacimonas sp. 4484_209]